MSKEEQEIFNEISKEDIWRKWQSDKKALIKYMKALSYYGVTQFTDVEKLAEMYDVNNENNPDA